MVSTLAEIGLLLAKTQTLLAKLQASMLCGQVAEHAAPRRVCAACRLQTLVGTVEVDAPRFKMCGCRRLKPLAGVTVSLVCALLTARCMPELERVPDHAQINVERQRHLPWNGRFEKAREALGRITSWAKDAVVPNEPAAEAKVRRLAVRCAELRRYIGNNEDALIDYGQRHRAGKPILTSRAEGAVDQLAITRMNKRRQMRWLFRGVALQASTLPRAGAASWQIRSLRGEAHHTPLLLVPQRVAGRGQRLAQGERGNALAQRRVRLVTRLQPIVRHAG